MKTYQDLLEVVNNEALLKEFIISAINEYKSSEDYRWAKEGDAYDKQENTTILTYSKLLYTVSGRAVPDNFSANYKLTSNFYNRFNVQENQYLLGNGVNFDDNTIKDKLGTKKKPFDTQVQKLGKIALTQGKGYGFFNLDHIEVFDRLEFVPFVDEEDGSLKAGIRFWQIDEAKPLRATLYQLDGYTEYIRRPKKNSELEVLKPKRAYKLIVRSTEADGDEIYDGENYNGFPIVPLWGNQDHVIKIKAWKRKIDCYDLISSGFANDIDDASLIYWTISNAGGMDDIDLAEFVQKMKTVHAVNVADQSQVQSHTQDIPVEGREACLNRLESDLIKDAMALNTDAIAKGNTVATAIRAAYEPLNQKTNDFEYCVNEFIQGILDIAGLEGDPTFRRSTVVNQLEETQMVLSASSVLDTETIIKKLPFIEVDEVDEVLDRVIRDEASRFVSEEDEINAGQSEDTNG